jgi:hypothetical protein
MDRSSLLGDNPPILIDYPEFAAIFMEGRIPTLFKGG